MVTCVALLVKAPTCLYGGTAFDSRINDESYKQEGDVAGLPSFHDLSRLSGFQIKKIYKI